MDKLKNILKELKKGRPVLIYDFDQREGEVDMVYPATNITPKNIARLRNDAGGLVCVSIHPKAAEKLGLGFAKDIIDPKFIEKSEYGYSTFSMWLNHRSTYTGITDKDRSKTARKLAEAVKTVLTEKYQKKLSDNIETGEELLAKEFKAPGHVPVLRANEGLLNSRQGHTEMSVFLVQEAGLAPAAVICEMLDDETGDALTPSKAKEYASKNNFIYIDGEELVELFKHKRTKIG